MADRLQSENLALIFQKVFFHLFMGVLGQEWRAWSTSSHMPCLGDSYTVTQCWDCKLWKPFGQHTAMKNVSEKYVKGTCEKFCEKNRAKNSAKKLCEKNREKTVKKTSGNTVKKCAKKFVKKNIAGTAGRTTFECEKNFTEFFTFFGPGCLQPFVGGGGVCDSWDPFPWHCRYGRMRVYPPLTASMFPGRGTSMNTCSCIFLASLAPPCPSIRLIQ